MNKLGFVFLFFFFNDTATTEIYTLSLHDALPISSVDIGNEPAPPPASTDGGVCQPRRSEEHTSELQSLAYLVCRLLLEKQNLLQSRLADRPTLCRGSLQSRTVSYQAEQLGGGLPGSLPHLFFLAGRLPRRSTLFPYTTLFR